MSKTIICLAQENGSLGMTPYQRITFQEFIKGNKGDRIRVTLEEYVPESKAQRAFYHGAVLVLWAYLDGKDYRDSRTLEIMHEIAKAEFNPEIFMLNGKEHRVGKSSKGKLNEGYVESIIDYLQENYGIDPAKVLNVDLYKKFRDQIYGFSTYDCFIDYMVAMNLL